MESFKKISPIYIGTIIAFVSLLIAQIKMNSMLPSKLYLIVAVVSCNLVIIDLLKSFSSAITRCDKIIEEFNDIFLHNKEIFCVPNTDKSTSQRLILNYSEKIKLRQTKSQAFYCCLKKTIDIAVYFIYIYIVFMCITIPLKVIPDSFLTNRLIGVITLLTFIITVFLLGVNQYVDAYEEQAKSEADEFRKAVDAVKALRKCNDEIDKTGE